MAEKEFPISEIFSSFQGEGPYQGTDSTFIRFAGCNLKCSWCDSKFTWKPGEIEFTMMNMESIGKEINKHKNKHLVITGGEPMLYQQAIKTIRQHYPEHFIEIETSGSIALQIDESHVDHFNISPKLSNSGNKNYQLKLKPRNCIFKFVVQDIKEIEEIKLFIEEWEIQDEKVWLMPEGTDKKTLEERTSWLEKVTAENKWQFTNRLHILRYGNKRGV